ncbi:MAG: carbohydrate binding domain-containing protein [Spirochaetota bacterium]|mgnify:CR=1 FL=1
MESHIFVSLHAALKRTIPLCIAAVCVSTVYSQNLVKNPGFEDSADKSWSANNWAKNEVTADFDAGSPHSGKLCFRISMTRVVKTAHFQFWQALSVTPGMQVEFRFWVRGKTGTKPLQAQFRKVGAPYTAYFETTVPLDEVWREHIFTLTLPPNTDPADTGLMFNLLEESALWLDDVSVMLSQKAMIETPAVLTLQEALPDRFDIEMLGNNGFEQTAQQNGIANGWMDDSSWAPVKVAYSADTLTPHSGKCAQKVECTEFKGGAVVFRSLESIVMGRAKTYRIALWMKGETALPVYVQLRKKPAPYTTYMERRFTISPEWQECVVEDIAPVNDTDAGVFISMKASGTLFIDDISCRQMRGEAANLTNFITPGVKIPPTYIGNHLHRANTTTPWPNVPFKTWRLLDYFSMWSQLEPVKGRWDFTALDRCVALAIEHDVEPLMMLWNTPAWASARPNDKAAYHHLPGIVAEPKDIEDWKNYVRTVSERYKGKIRYYEVWNEPNDMLFFSGKVEDLVELTRTARRVLKAVDPGSKVVSAGIVHASDYLDSFLAKGGKDACDIVGYHFYPAGQTGTPESEMLEIHRVQKIMAKHGIADRELWNTETGWTIHSETIQPTKAFGYDRAIQPRTAADYLARHFVLSWGMGVDRFIFYAWDNKFMGGYEINEKDNTVAGDKPFMSEAFRSVNEWLVGAVMNAFSCDADGTWTAKVTRDNGYRASIVWNPEKEAELPLNPSWGLTKAKDLYGGTRAITGAVSIKVSSSPLLLE